MSPRRAVAAALAAAALGLAVPAAADAGTFRVSQCNAVDHSGLAARGMQSGLWSVIGGWAASTCGAPGGGLAFVTPDHRLLSGTSLVAFLSVPASMPATTLRAAWLDWRSVPQTWSTNNSWFMVTAEGVRLIYEPSGGGTRPGASEWHALPGGARSLGFHTWCSTYGGEGWCNWPSHLLELRGVTVELEDPAAPEASAGGPLTAGGDRAGADPLWVAASDRDSGVRRVAVTLGGILAGAVEPPDGCRDDRLPPCPPAIRSTLDVDTRLVPDGIHRLRLVATDAAGNQRTVDAGTVSVLNRPQTGWPAPAPGGPPGVPDRGTRPATGSPPPDPIAARRGVANGTDASERAVVRAWLETRPGARRLTASVPAYRRVRVGGRVRDEAGRPIGGATLVRLDREPAGPWRAATRVRTRGDGRFTTFTRAPTSRRLRFVYHPFAGSPARVRSRTLRVSVPAPVSARAWRDEATVRIRGRLGGGRVPRGGALVELQRLAGGRWTGVGALRTTRTGRFAARVSTPRVAVLRLRAVVPAQPGLPYATGRSPAVEVR